MNESHSIHRLLDDAFRGVDLTPEAQDLKEELRGNLLARAAELEANGTPASDAALQAIQELGDVTELLGVEAAAATASAATESYESLQRRHRVRPNPAYVVRTAVALIVLVTSLTLAVVGSTPLMPLPFGVLMLLVGLAAPAIGWLVADGLTQETATNHPMPRRRAGGYFFATDFMALGLGFGALVGVGVIPMWGIVIAALGVISAIILFAFLGATQTNRRKAWARRAEVATPRNRFEEEPEAAARFGIYTLVIWIVAFGAILIVLTIQWWWAIVVFAAALALMMLVLARMLFPPRPRS